MEAVQISPFPEISADTRAPTEVPGPGLGAADVDRSALLARLEGGVVEVLIHETTKARAVEVRGIQAVFCQCQAQDVLASLVHSVVEGVGAVEMIGQCTVDVRIPFIEAYSAVVVVSVSSHIFPIYLH